MDAMALSRNLGVSGTRDPRAPKAKPLSKDPKSKAPTSEAQGLGARLREGRRLAKLPMWKAGEAIGVSKSSMVKYESGAVVPEPWAVTRLAELYGVDPEWIRTGAEDLRPPLRTSPARREDMQRAAAPPVDHEPPPAAPLAAPRRYWRLICPTCGSIQWPDKLEDHLVSGEGCARQHTEDEAADLFESAHRDPQPWLEAIEYLVSKARKVREQMATIKDRRVRKNYKEAALLMERQAAALQITGPDRFASWDPLE